MVPEGSPVKLSEPEFGIMTASHSESPVEVSVPVTNAVVPLIGITLDDEHPVGTLQRCRLSAAAVPAKPKATIAASTVTKIAFFIFRSSVAGYTHFSWGQFLCPVLCNLTAKRVGSRPVLPQAIYMKIRPLIYLYFWPHVRTARVRKKVP